MNTENTTPTPTTEKPTKPKHTDSEKLAEWYAKKDKLLEQQTADIIAFLKKIPKGTTLDEITNRELHRNSEQLHL